MKIDPCEFSALKKSPFFHFLTHISNQTNRQNNQFLAVYITSVWTLLHVSNLSLNFRFLWHGSGRFLVFCLLNTNNKSDRYMCRFGYISVRQDMHEGGKTSRVFAPCEGTRVTKSFMFPVVLQFDSGGGALVKGEGGGLTHVSRGAVRSHREGRQRRTASRSAGGTRTRYSGICPVTLEEVSPQHKLSCSDGKNWTHLDSCFYPPALKQAVKVRLDFASSCKNKTGNLVHGTLSWQHRT